MRQRRVNHHFSARIILPDLANSPREDRVASRKARNEDYRKLRALGWKPAYFPFRGGDEAAEARARAAAEAHAREWEEKSGVKLTVEEGMFL